MVFVPAAGAPPQQSDLTDITLLYTSDEHGWLLPFKEGGRTWGGAAEVLGAWITREGHCPGPQPREFDGQAAPVPDAPSAPGCEDRRTIAISGGDSYTGPAVTTFFAGAPMAQALARMGYVASALGNHEFDFGRERFVRNRAASGMEYLAANVQSRLPDMHLPPYVMVERRGVKVAFVGLATDTTLSTAMASRFTGVNFLSEEAPLDAAVRGAWRAHADVVVVIAHECADVVAPILARHPEWRLAFFGAAHCHKVVEQVVNGTPLVSPGWRFAHYVRVPIVVDRAAAPGRRLVSSRAEVVDVVRDDSTIAPVDAPLSALVSGYAARLDAALGEPIGFSRQGMAKGSQQIARWIAGAWREELHADVAIINMGGIRQAVSKGPLTLATVWSVMPFDNKLIVARVSGRQLVDDVRVPDMATSGLVEKGDGYALSDGRRLDPDKVYSVVTIDFLYLGGAHVTMRTQDPSATDTGIDWREPVVAWTKRGLATPDVPVELRLPPGIVVTPE
ncbi:MAG TPA: 5'-nucleotidase C-terminal domain-containing protein [Byssovorax sp.]